MKKVLTLVSALSMVAGSAVAHDYNWNFNDAKLEIGKGDLANLTQTGKVSVTKDGLKFTEGTGNFVKFGAQTKDVVTVHAAGSEGNFYVQVGTSLYSAKISERTSLDVTVPSDGDVQIWADNGVVITKISAQSEAYRTVDQLINGTRDILNRRINDIAPYVNTSTDFYLGVKAEYNAQGEALESVIADLADLAKMNEVANNGGEAKLIAALDLIKKTIGTSSAKAEGLTDAEKGTILLNAEAAMADYKSIIGGTATNAKAAKDEINKRKAKSVGNAYSIYKDKVQNKQTIYVERWAGIENTYKTYVEDENAALKKGALDELGLYPKHDFVAYDLKFKDVVDRSKNVFARYEFENGKTIVAGQGKNNLAFIGGLSAVAEELQKLSADNSQLFDATGLDAEKTDAEKLSAKIKKADNKHTISDLNGEFKTPASTLNNSFNSKKNAWGTAAQNNLNDQITPLQKKFDEYSYKVTSQYQNDVETLRKYQAEFAKLQNQIDDVKKAISDVSTPEKAYNVAKGWKTYNKNLSDVDAALNKLWGDTQSAENAAIIAKNNEEITKLEKKVEDARTYYQNAVAEVDKYRKADFFAAKKTTTDADKLAVTKFAEDIKTLYDYSLEMETALAEAKNVRDASNTEVVNNKPTAKLVDFTTYNATVDAKIKAIEDALKASKKEANDIAFKYYTFTDMTTWPMIIGALDEATDYVNDVSSVTTKYASDNKISADAAFGDATTRFNVILKGAYDKKGKLIVADNDLANASDKINALYKDQLLALDVVGGKTVDAILQKSKDAADGILADLTKYNGMKKQIVHYQVEWSVAKAASDKDNTALQDKLEAFHKVLDADQATLEKTDKLNAVQADYDKKYEAYASELEDINNFDVYQANVAAETAINKALTTVKGDVATAKTELAKLSKEAAKDILSTAITNAEDVIKTVETEFVTAKADKKTAEKKDELISRLTALKLADSIKAAQEKDKVVEGDLNGDGIVNEADFEAANLMSDNEKMTDDEYSIFMSTYIKSLNK